MKTRAILLKIRRDEEKEGWVRGALCVADAAPTLPRPHIYMEREELEEDRREVRTWRTISFALYRADLLPRGLYQIKMRWSPRYHAMRPYLILEGEDESEEKRLILRPADPEESAYSPAVFWDEPHPEDINCLKEMVLRRRINATLKCRCEVWLRVD